MSKALTTTIVAERRFPVPSHAIQPGEGGDDEDSAIDKLPDYCPVSFCVSERVDRAMNLSLDLLKFHVSFRCIKLGLKRCLVVGPVPPPIPQDPQHLGPRSIRPAGSDGELLSRTPVDRLKFAHGLGGNVGGDAAGVQLF